MPNLWLGFLAKEAAKQRFRGFNITLPAIPAGSATPLRGLRPQMMRAQSSVAQVATVGSSLAGAARASVLGGSGAPSPPPPPPASATPMQFPPALFRAASSSVDDVSFQKGMHDMFGSLFDNIIDAIEHGFNQYRLTAGLVDVTINAALAMGGRLQGPAIDGLIARAPQVAGWGGWDAMVRDAVAKGIEHQWSALARSVRVPGLPWYPAFVAFPGPQAPPMPNIPTPFMTLAHDALAMSPQNLKTAMRSALNGNMDYCMQFFESVAVALQMPLMQWKSSQQIMGVMGKGPCPSFAPPYVPVAPVLMGSNLSGAHINT